MGILLGGGGSAKQTVISNKLFESLIDSEKPILYIPLAWNHYDEGYQNCKKFLIGEFSNIKHGEIEVIQSAKEISTKKLSDYSAIFIGGGNTYKLLKLLKDSDAFEQIKEYIENGGTVYGGSAGAAIFGKNINSILYMDTNNVELTDTTGFNLLFGFSLTVHYTNQDEEYHKKATEYLKKHSGQEPVIALPEENSLYTDGNIVKIVGTRPWHIFNNRKIKQLNPNIEFTKNDFINTVNNLY
jgi:dipeptidase E